MSCLFLKLDLIDAANEYCFFFSPSDEDRLSHILFFLFPIGLHIFINAILFVLTAIHCNKIKNEIHRMQCSKDNDTEEKKRKFVADRAK